MNRPIERVQMPKWSTRQMVESDHGTREKYLRTTLREILIYIVFMMFVTFVAYGNFISNSYLLVNALEMEFMQKDFELEHAVAQFDDILTHDDLWDYILKVVVPTIYNLAPPAPSATTVVTTPDPNATEATTPAATTTPAARIADRTAHTQARFDTILEENKVLGPPRIRQVKVADNTCTVPTAVKSLLKKCYAPYSSRAEDISKIRMKTEGRDIQRTAYTYSYASETGSASYAGKLATYGGGGYYQVFGLFRTDTENMLRTLKSSDWVDHGTRVLIIEFSVYNANLNIFCIVKLAFEFSAAGGIRTSSEFLTVQLVSYVRGTDSLVIIAELVCFVMLIFYIMEEVREILHFRTRYLKSFWNYIDLTIIGVGVICCLMVVVKLAQSGKVAKKVKDLTKYISLDTMANVNRSFDIILAIFVFLTYIKLFKYMTFSKAMGQLNSTLERCAVDILAFMIMFFVMFIAFAQVGYMLFGSRVESYSTVPLAMFTLLRTTLGDFNYLEIEAANRSIAPIFFLTYIFFVFFVLLNMFLAIINDAYTDVKNEAEASAPELQMTTYVKRLVVKLLGMCGLAFLCKKLQAPSNKNELALDEIRSALKKLGFTNGEIAMFFARYNIEPGKLQGQDPQDIKAALAQMDNLADYFVPPGKKLTSGDASGMAAQSQRITRLEEAADKLLKQTTYLIKELESFEKVEGVTKTGKV